MRLVFSRKHCTDWRTPYTQKQACTHTHSLLFFFKCTQANTLKPRSHYICNRWAAEHITDNSTGPWAWPFDLVMFRKRKISSEETMYSVIDGDWVLNHYYVQTHGFKSMNSMKTMIIFLHHYLKSMIFEVPRCTLCIYCR